MTTSSVETGLTPSPPVPVSTVASTVPILLAPIVTPTLPRLPSLVYPDGVSLPTLTLTYVDPPFSVEERTTDPRILGLEDANVTPGQPPLADLSKLVGLTLVIQAAGIVWFGIQSGSFGNFRLASSA